MSSRVPIRHCMGCNGAFEKKTLLRICKTKDGEISFDASGKAEGRGAYICKSAECLKKVQKSRRFNRVMQCRIDDEIYETLAKEVER